MVRGVSIFFLEIDRINGWKKTSKDVVILNNIYKYLIVIYRESY